MNSGRLIFWQLMDLLSYHEFYKCVARYRGDHGIRKFYYMDQFLFIAFDQITARESATSCIPCWIYAVLFPPSFISAIASSTMFMLYDLIPIGPGAFYVVDRGCLDFKRLHGLRRLSAFFLIRTKRTLKYVRIKLQPIDPRSQMISDQVTPPPAKPEAWKYEPLKADYQLCYRSYLNRSKRFLII